jgi:hypothetical protein
MNLLIPKSRPRVYHGGHLGLAAEAAGLAPSWTPSSPHRDTRYLPGDGRTSTVTGNGTGPAGQAG